MPPLTAPPRIFVVDDEPTIASTLAAILSMNGFSTRAFTRPAEVMTAAQADIPDVLISDVVMPDLSGVDLAIQMKVRHPACKVLLFRGKHAPQICSPTPVIKGTNFVCSRSQSSHPSFY
jgi:DNA-binding NtrC family response regulator